MSDAEETCGHTVVDADGIEEPCGLPVALGGWRYYEGHEHEDTLRRVCADHEQWALSNGIRARDAEVRAETLAEFTEYFAAAFTSSDGRVATMGHHVLDREYAMKEAVEMSSPEDATPSFVARRLVGPWEPEP